MNHTIFDLEGEARGVVAVGTTPSRGRASTSYVFMAEHMQRARLRRERPGAADAEIESAIQRWLLSRPDAPVGDAVGRASQRFA